MSISEQTDAILRATGDLLLQLGTETPRRVPNTPRNADKLNDAVAQYQQHLDAIELEIVRSIAAVRERTLRAQEPPAAEATPPPNAAPGSDLGGPGLQNNNGDDLGLALGDDALGQTLDADLFDLDQNDLDIFGTAPSPGHDFSLDNEFF